MDHDDLLEKICLRPKMFFEPIATTRDLIFFLRGVCCGAKPPHGSGIPDFGAFIVQRLGGELNDECFTVLLKEFGDDPLSEGCEEICQLLNEWKVSR